jgi:hypothetical protein
MGDQALAPIGKRTVWPDETVTRSFTILTTTPDAEMAALHDCMLGTGGPKVKFLKIAGYMIGYYLVLASVWASWNRWRPSVAIFYILALVQVHLGVFFAHKICMTPDSNRGQIYAFASVSLLTVYMIGLTFLEFYGVVSPTPRIVS